MTLIIEHRPKRLDKEIIGQMFDGSLKGDAIIEAIQELQDKERKAKKK